MLFKILSLYMRNFIKIKYFCNFIAVFLEILSLFYKFLNSQIIYI